MGLSAARRVGASPHGRGMCFWPHPRQDTLAFQVDLWSARGELPGNLAEVETRRKEIQCSSRTRANTDQFKERQLVRCALASLLPNLPEELPDSEEAKYLSSIAD